VDWLKVVRGFPRTRVFPLAQKGKGYRTKKMSQGGNPDKVKQVQAQVEEVKGIMHQNIEKVIERGDKIENLQEKTDELQNSAQQFKKSTTKLKRQMWWKNMKLNLIIAFIVIAILLILILGAVCGVGLCHGYGSSTPAPTSAPTPTAH